MASIAQTLMSRTARDGGVTVSLVSGDIADHTSGFYVGGRVKETIVKDPADIGDYLTAVSTITRRAGGVGYIGAWKNDETGWVHIDASDHVPDFESAVRIAQERGELAIWEIAGGTEYRL
jgi:hypothetical protein